MAQLLPEQEALLSTMCEAALNVSHEYRHFLLSELLDGTELEVPSETERRRLRVATSDLRILEREDYVMFETVSSHLFQLTITAQGYEHWRQTRRAAGQPVERVETQVRSYLDADMFRKAYPQAYAKWVQAEERLSSSTSADELTTIGHECREAMQLFATALVERYKPPAVDPDPAKTKSRILAVLDHRAGTMSNRVRALLNALLDYWNALVDLGQRQEHGGQKGGEPLVPEDGRRLVFQTAIVMFEIARVIS